MAATDYDWPRSPPPSQQLSSPDTTSPMYPDRLIRPLPKRRLRARLSEDEAKTIEFPPAPPTVAPLFNLPYVEKTQNFANRVPRSDGDEHKCQCGADHGVGSDSAYVDDADGSNERATRRASAEAEYVPWEQAGSFSKPPPPGSTTSSADGYESFENTNNKKKRKIPLSGGSNHHHSSLSAEMVNMSISNPANDSSLLEDGATTGSQYYGTASSALSNSSSGTGISGAGRGRFGRPKHSMERRPLGASTNGLNAFASNYSGNGGAKGKRDWAASGGKDQGIISAAIANAAEQGHAMPPVEGSENVSLLQQQAAKSVPPQTSQFTFSMDSEAGKALYGTGGHPASNVLPGSSHVPPAGYNGKGRGGAAHPNSAGTAPPPAGQQQYQQQPAQGGANNNGQGGNQRPPRPRKPLSRLYQIAARQRRIQQEYQNYHHPPTSRDDIWICEFCEYEAIFGVEPVALVRQYEEKDRKERKRLAEKRRLLEKAKMKGRKNRKGAKGKNKSGGSHANNNNAHANSNQQNYDPEVDSLTGHPPDPQEDEFFDDEFDDEPIAQGPPPPPTPTAEPVDHGAHGGGTGGGTANSHGSTRAPPAWRTRKA